MRTLSSAEPSIRPCCHVRLRVAGITRSRDIERSGCRGDSIRIRSCSCLLACNAAACDLRGHLDRGGELTGHVARQHPLRLRRSQGEQPQRSARAGGCSHAKRVGRGLWLERDDENPEQ